jgi:xanthosine utilization system XapX-like protein
MREIIAMKSNNAAKRFLDLLAGILFGFMLASFIVDVTSPNAIKYIGLFGIVGWTTETCLRIWLERKQSRSTAANNPPGSTQS